MNIVKTVYQCRLFINKSETLYYPRGGATPLQLTPDMWAQIGGKWVLLEGRKQCISIIYRYYCLRVYTHVFLESLHP